MLWHHFVKNLLDSLKVEDAMSNSFKNFHAEGLDYLCLHRSENLTVKIYDIAPSIKPANNKFNVLVNPHSHGYDFHTIFLKGDQLDNVVFKFIPNAIGSDKPIAANNNLLLHNHFKYISPLKVKGDDVEKSGFKFNGIGNLVIDKTESLTKVGDSYFLDHNSVHSIRPHTSRVTLLLLQYKDVDKLDTDFYCQEATVPNNNKLYQKFTKEEIISFINRMDNICVELIEAEKKNS